MKAILLGIILLSFISSAYAQEEFTMKELTASGAVLVELTWPEIGIDEIRDFAVSFRDPANNELLNDVAFDLVIMQADHVIEDYNDEVANGAMTLQVLFEDTGPATIDVNVKSVDNTSINEKVTFSVNVVPEFPIMISIITAVSMAIVIALRFNAIAKVRLA